MIQDKKSRQYRALVDVPEHASITVGIHAKEGGSVHTDSGLSIVELGEIHEFGLGVPQRSFVRKWAAENEASAQDVIGKELQLSLKDGNITTHLERAALRLEADMKANISSGTAFEKLDDATIAQKGSSTPLIDTGALRASLAGRVEGAR